MAVKIFFPEEYYDKDGKVEKRVSFALKRDEFEKFASGELDLENVTVFDMWFKGSENKWFVLSTDAYKNEEIVLMRASDYYAALKKEAILKTQGKTTN